jgi:hypothetical protein
LVPDEDEFSKAEKTIMNWQAKLQWLIVVAFLSASTLPEPCAGQEPAERDPLLKLNQQFRGAYHRALAAELAQTQPIILDDQEKIVLLNGKERTEADIVPALYTHLKAVAHVPLGVYSLLALLPEGDLPAETLADLEKLRPTIVAARAVLSERGFSAAQLERQQKIMAACLEFVNQLNREKKLSLVDLDRFARNLGPLVLANAADAAEVQINLYQTHLKQWRGQLTPEQWQNLKVVVIGSQMPRKGNLAVQYFAKLLGEKGEGKRIVYAESLWDEKKALSLLAAYQFDRKAGTAFFNEPDRLARDLLADAAAEYLQKLKIGE